MSFICSKRPRIYLLFYVWIMRGIDSSVSKTIERKENPGILVWIVDDDEGIRSSLERYLKVSVGKEINLNIKTFSDGESAIKELSSSTSASKPDIITLDGDLGPGKLRGEEIAHNIAGHTDSLIVAMSSSDVSNERIEQFALEAGGRAKIVSKAHPRELARMIIQMVSGEDTGDKN